MEMEISAERLGARRGDGLGRGKRELCRSGHLYLRPRWWLIWEPRFTQIHRIVPLRFVHFTGCNC